MPAFSVVRCHHTIVVPSTESPLLHAVEAETFSREYARAVTDLTLVCWATLLEAIASVRWWWEGFELAYIRKYRVNTFARRDARKRP